MTEKLKQTIKEELLNLSKEAQEAINSVDWVNIVEEIGKKSLMTEEEIENFQTETLLVLVGVEESESYKENIEIHVGTTKDKAENLEKEMFEKVFKPIKTLMEDNIKKKVKDGGQKWNQNIDFIVSGGDYSAFIDRREPVKTENNNTDKNTPANPMKKIEDFKKVEDLKSKFTI